MQKRIISVLSTLVISQSLLAQTSREEATSSYLEATLQRFTEAQKTVDPTISLEGMAIGVQPTDLTPGYAIIEGDIQVPSDQLGQYVNPERSVFGTVNYWGATVPYDFAANVNAANQTAAINAMNAISGVAGVTFVAHASQPDWIRFNASTFNNSPVGRQGGQQIINITSWNTHVIIVHEIYHSLGFWHEQSAPDRDTYVTINNGNICGSSSVPGNQCNPNVCQQCADSGGNFISCAFNFNIQGGTSVYGPYDFDSFMHYGRTAFSCNGGDTITVNNPWNSIWQNLIGQRDHFSLIDRLTCRGIYPFNGDRWLRSGAGGSNSGNFFNPFNGTFAAAYNASPTNGTMLVDPGTYSGIGIYTRALTIQGTYGVASIGN